MPTFPNLDFSCNWNGKLKNLAFTTIRPKNNRFRVGERFQVRLNCGNYHEILGIVEVVDVKIMRWTDFNDWYAYLDTGLCLEEFLNTLSSFYKDDAPKLRYSLVLLKYISINTNI